MCKKYTTEQVYGVSAKEFLEFLGLPKSELYQIVMLEIQLLQKNYDRLRIELMEDKLSYKLKNTDSEDVEIFKNEALIETVKEKLKSKKAKLKRYKKELS